MCGIGGILRTDGKRIPATWVKAIDARIAHRGPDGAGTFRDRVEPGTDDETATEVVLIHRRLSIIDHEGGGQPMVSKRGRNRKEGLVAVVFNGCIYNHRELRAELEASGHEFVSDHSDTEVLVHGHRQWGRRLPEHLEGMYAYAIWDRSAATLTLGRDWFGEKPLYVRRGLGKNRSVTAFSSDARSLAMMSVPKKGATLLERWPETYLQLGYNHGGETVYAGTDGRAVTLASPGIERRIDDLLAGDGTDGAANDAGGDLPDFEQLIDDAVARRLEADVPVGCFLSGGVDSSLVALFARKHEPDISTFCVRMPDPRYDESAHAQAVADHLGTRHTTLSVAVRPADDLQRLVHVLGQPFGDSSILPMYWVSKAAREHVTVALTGDGGDELFIGYERYVAVRSLARYRPLLRWLPTGLFRSAHPKSRLHKLARLGDMARDVPAAGLLAMESLFTQDDIAALLGRPPREPACLPLDGDPLQSLRRADLLGYLPNDLLCKVDTASMMVALEVRAPLLDHALIRAALATPPDRLLTGRRRKGLLRTIARRHLPARLVDRPKMGFAVPIGHWFRNDFGSMRTLLLDHLRSREPFGPIPLRRSVVKRLIDEHLSRRRDHGQRLFALLTLSIWAKGLPEGTKAPTR